MKKKHIALIAAAILVPLTWAVADTISDHIADAVTPAAGDYVPIYRVGQDAGDKLTVDLGTALAAKAPLASPTFTGTVTAPTILGGTGTTSDLVLQTTSGVGATGADMHFLVGNNGATEALTILNDGKVGFGATTINNLVTIGARNAGTAADRKAIEMNAGGFGAPAAFNTNSNGDKLILYRDATGSYDATIGVGSSSDMWFKSSGTGANSGGFVWHSGSTPTSRMILDPSGNLGIGTTPPDTRLDVAGAITSRELSADPGNPDEGAHVIWQSDGTGFGDDGDIVIKITAGGVTKTVTLVDFSAATDEEP